MRTLAMFPLGSVLLPHMPLRLRVFEQRYLVMLNSLLEARTAEFGVVLIERGQEVGGGEHRFSVGTVAEITGIGTEEGFLGLVAMGRERFSVHRWLPDEPHPRAEVELMPPMRWDPALERDLLETEQAVRRSLAVASEFREHVWPADIELSDDPLAACWQLAGIAPLGAIDQLDLLRVASASELLAEVRRRTEEAADTLAAPWPELEDE